MIITRRAVATLAVASVAALGIAPSAFADGGGNIPFIQYQAAGTGQVQDLTAGTDIDLNYVDPSGQTTATDYCWSPAPANGPECSATPSGVLAQPGLQTITAQLSNGQSVSTSFTVEPGNAPNPVAPQPKTYSRTIALRPNRTVTYHLNVPEGFTPATRTAVNYALYPTSGEGYAVGYSIGANGGRHQPYFNATVLRSSFRNDQVSITVRTGALARPMALHLAARGTA